MFRGLAAFVVCLLPVAPAAAQLIDVASQLRDLDAGGFPAETVKEKRLAEMVERDQRRRIHEAHDQQAKLFETLQTRADWHKFRDVRLQALRESLGTFPAVPRDLKVRKAAVSRT